MSDFYCVHCGNKGIPIMRKKGSEREAGHLKKLWCLHCQKETNHAECKPYSHYTYEDFLFEKEQGNFNEEGGRVLPLNKFHIEMNKRGLM